MNELEQWVFSVAATVILISLAENLLGFCKKVPAVQWILRLVLLLQLLKPMDTLMRWLKGG